MNNYARLISSLDAFIRKYYINQLIRGSLILLICLLFYILTVSVGEYFLYMPVWMRVGILVLFVLAGTFSLIWWVAIPLAKTARLGKVISHETAATIIGKHFPEVSDKLLNILQLHEQNDTYSSKDLIAASIDQKAAQISVVPISLAIDLGKNKKYLKYLLPLLLVGVFILIAAPNVFRESSERLLQPTKSFEKPAPFQFVIKTMPLQAVRNADYVLQIEATGNALPAEMSVDMGKERVPMQVVGRHTFQYTFRNMTEAVNFKLFAAGYYSHEYTLQVVQKPMLKAFKVQVDYPDYTGKKDEIKNSLGDMTLPVGTKVRWGFIAEHTDYAQIRMGAGDNILMPKNDMMFGYEFRFMNDTAYTISLHNKQTQVADSFEYHVQVIPDQYPVIQMQEVRDTVSGKQIYLHGTAGDDYGISRVMFHYDITTEKNQPILSKSIPLKITSGALTSFQHYFDVQMLNLQPGQKMTYYIEAWDNDGVHGSKASRSEVMSYAMYNAEQIDSAINANAEQINSGISNSAQQTQKLQSEYKEMQSKMLQSDQADWQQQQSLQEMSKKQMDLQSQVENVKKRFEEQIQQSKQKDYSDEVKDKQEDIKKQLDNLLSNELKEQMKKLQELMQKMNKEQAMTAMQEMEQENKLFNMDLQRMQELMKKLEAQMRMEDMATKMGDLAKKELDLKKATDEGKKDNAALSKEQKELKKELSDAMKEEMKELEKQNKELKQSTSLEDEKDKAKKAEQKMAESEQDLNEQKNKKASDAEKEAADNLQDMAESLKSKAGGMEMEEIELDIKATRQILTNLIRLSFDQEQLMKTVQQTPPTSQQYVVNQEEQNRLHSNSVMIRDSLFSLSKRAPKLSTFVNKETTDLEHNIALVISALENRNTANALTREQYVMTHTNNLALMLNELLNNLIQQQRNMMKKPGSGSCNNPGGMSPKLSKGKSGNAPGMQLKDIITQQQKLGEGMSKMQGKSKSGKDGDKGKKPGDKPGQEKGGQKPGGQSGDGGQGDGESESNSEEISRLAEQQASLRRQLQQLNSILNSKGMSGNAKELREISEKMDKNETDLVNKRLTSELQMRQKEILTRLLEAEKSLREQEQDDKRSSKSALDISRPVPPELQKYIQDNQKLLELYKTIPPQLKPYYKAMVDQYYNIIGNSNNK
ncbi:MAG: DUF4175 family protein [Bacteroidota bacterium]